MHGTAFGHFPLGSDNLMVTALGPKLKLHIFTLHKITC
jgi:hypothetical protein